MDEKQEQSVVNQQEAANEKPKITPEFIDQLAKDEVFQKWLQSEKDRHFSKGLETWKENNLSSIVEEEIKKRYPEETEEIGKHTSELQSRENLVCRLLLEKKKKNCRRNFTQINRRQ